MGGKTVSYKTGHKKMIEKISLIVIGIILVSSLVTIQSVYSASITFPLIIQLSDNNSIDSEIPQVTSSGNNVYTVWQEGTKILLTSSNNLGTTSTAPVELGDGSDGNPKIVSSGDKAFAIWSDDTSVTSDIKLKLIADNGNDLSGMVVLLSSSTNLLDSELPEVTLSDSDNAFAVWRDKVTAADYTILFSDGGPDGIEFGNDNFFAIGHTDRVFSNPQLTTSDDNVYVVWHTIDHVRLAVSDDGGTSFSPASTIGDCNCKFTQVSPQIASSGDHVYVIWQNGADVKFASSSNKGTSFNVITIGDPLGSATINSSPDIAAAGNNVYAVWSNDNPTPPIVGDIQFFRSTNNGVDFDVTNLSNNAGHSANPTIEASGNNVYVAWEDDTTSPGIPEIFSMVSDDQGTTFDLDILSTTGISLKPDLASSGDNVFVAWQDDTRSADDFDILFSVGTLGGPEISFDNPNGGNQYRDSETATITIIEEITSGDPSIVANVKSSSDDTGVDITLTPTGAAGTYDGTVTFTTGSSLGSLLEVKAGDIVTASFDGNNGIASIFSRTVMFDGGFTTFDPGNFAHIKVIDQNSNIDPTTAETISVDVKSIGDSVGITLIIPETGPDTGIFGGDGLTDLIFTKDPNTITNSGSMIVEQIFRDPTLNPSEPDTVDVNVKSTSDPLGFTLTLTETENDSETFVENLILTPFPTGARPNSIHTEQGDFITISRDTLLIHKLVNPNPNLANGEILIDSTPNTADMVEASFKEASEIATVFDVFASGGGGGGLVRPGLVVNIIAGAGLFGGGSGGGANPTFGDATILVLDDQSDGFGGTISDGDDISLDSTKVVKVGDEVVLRFELYENQGM